MATEMKKSLVFFFIIVCWVHCNGMLLDSLMFPKVGSMVPGYNRIINSSSDKADLHINANNPTVLIFWARYCAGCIRSFPKYNQAYNKYNDRLNVILIAPDDSIHLQIFKMYTEKMNLNLPSIYDSEIFNNRKSKLTPHAYWIDNAGNLKLETSQVSDSIIADFLEGTVTINQPTGKKDDERYDYKSLFLIDGNGGPSDTSFLFRSLLAEWKEGMGRNGLGIISHPIYLKKAKAEFIKITITDLYKIAYFGSKITSITNRYAPDPIFEMQDSSKFVDNKFYCYSLKVPPKKANKGFLMNAMQNDLKNYFGFDVVIEERSHPCLNLTFDGSDKWKNLLSNADSMEVETTPLRLDVKAVKLSDIIEHLASNLQEIPLIINKTTLNDSELIDMKLEGAIYVLPELRAQLKSKYGLLLLPGEVQLPTLVVRDITIE